MAEKDDQLKEMYATMKVIESEVKRVKKCVEGNGHIGLQDRVTKVEEKVKSNSQLADIIDANTKFRIGAKAIVRFIVVAASANVISAFIFIVNFFTS